MATHFLADLHLDNDHEPFARLLQQYLGGAARAADAVYVLGDLFEVWIGDDGSLPRHRATITAFAALAATGTPVYFIRGNRDFAVGDDFEKATGMQILDDLHVVDLYGTPTLLSHGDVFCTDDVEHQKFRGHYMDPQWRAGKLRWPVWARRGAAAWARRKSKRGKRRKPQDIMDVNTTTVANMMGQYQVTRLIHGHTHRPALHELVSNNQTCQRIVLPDWRPGQTGVLVVDATGWTKMWLPTATT